MTPQSYLPSGGGAGGAQEPPSKIPCLITEPAKK